MNQIDLALPREFYCDSTLPRENSKRCIDCFDCFASTSTSKASTNTNKSDVVYGFMFTNTKMIKVYGCRKCKTRWIQ